MGDEQMRDARNYDAARGAVRLDSWREHEEQILRHLQDVQLAREAEQALQAPPGQWLGQEAVQGQQAMQGQEALQQQQTVQQPQALPQQQAGQQEEAGQSWAQWSWQSQGWVWHEEDDDAWGAWTAQRGDAARAAEQGAAGSAGTQPGTAADTAHCTAVGDHKVAPHRSVLP